MFSKKFPTMVRDAFNRNDIRILATIPNKVTGGPLGTLLEALKKNPNCDLVEVSKANRNDLLDSICSTLEWIFPNFLWWLSTNSSFYWQKQLSTKEFHECLVQWWLCELCVRFLKYEKVQHVTMITLRCLMSMCLYIVN